MYCSCACYRPQRSCGKVMFSQASAILFTGGVADTPLGRHTPLERPPSLGRHPLGRHPWQTPPTQCMLGFNPPRPVHAGIHTQPLPSACWDTPPLPSACWNAFFLIYIYPECILVNAYPEKFQGFGIECWPLSLTINSVKIAIVFSGGSRISQTAAPTPKRGANLLFGQIFPENCMKIGLGHPWCPSLDLPMMCL